MVMWSVYTYAISTKRSTSGTTVKRTFRREHQLLLAIASVCLHSGAVWADKPHQMVLPNLAMSHLGSGITNSPLVGKKTIPEAMFGYLYQLI